MAVVRLGLWDERFRLELTYRNNTVLREHFHSLVRTVTISTKIFLAFFAKRHWSDSLAAAHTTRVSLGSKSTYSEGLQNGEVSQKSA